MNRTHYEHILQFINKNYMIDAFKIINQRDINLEVILIEIVYNLKAIRFFNVSG